MAAAVPIWRQQKTERVSFCKDARNAVALLTSADMAKHTPLKEQVTWNAERPERLLDTMEELREAGLEEQCICIPPQPATREQLLKVHDEKYVDGMLALKDCSDSETLLQVGRSFNTIYLNSESISAACTAAGAVCTAVDAVLSLPAEEEGGSSKTAEHPKVDHAVCVVRPPGHHAEHDCAMGFCIWNNVAVAVAHAKERLMKRRGAADTAAAGAAPPPRIAIVDWDVHHGNGCAQIFLSDPSVFYFSVHRWDAGGFYPGFIVDRVGPAAGGPDAVGEGAGRGLTMNLSWTGKGDYGAPVMGDKEYAAGWQELLLPCLREFQPELLFIAAGFDAARGDPLGDCDVTPAGFAALTAGLMTLGVPIILALEGGYNTCSVKHCLGACTGTLLGCSVKRRAVAGAGAAGAGAAEGSSAAETGVSSSVQWEGEALAAGANATARDCIASSKAAHKPYWKWMQKE